MLNDLLDDTGTETLSDLVGSLSVLLCKEGFTDGRASSTLLIYFSGVLGISPSATTFLRPSNYTPKISALIYCIRLCLLEVTLPRFAHEAVGWPARPLAGTLRRLNHVRERLMCLSYQAPMGELLSLRSYGRVVSRSDGPSFRVQWNKDGKVVYWDDGHISMEQFRELGSIALQRVRTSLAQLSYGIQPDFDLDHVVDRISNTARGYSFVLDPKNHFSTAYLDLSSRACLDSVNGLMLGDRWNMNRVNWWLKEESRLLTHLMLLIHSMGGQ